MATVESLQAIKKNKLYNLSPQQLIDCTNPSMSYRCIGYIYQAFKYIKNKGLTYQSRYPYQGESQKCALTSVSRAGWDAR